MQKKSEPDVLKEESTNRRIKFVYVTRHFNHSGYLILKKLIEENLKPDAIVLEKKHSPYLNPVTRPFAIAWYYFKCWYYRCPPIKTLASEELLAKAESIPILKTKTMGDDMFVQALSNLQPDLIVLGGGWHELIPPVVFQLPKLGCINTHPSLLPEFRGTSITRWQRLFGVPESGVSVHYVNENFDTGSVIEQKKMPVSTDISPQELFRQLGNVAAEMIPGIIRRFSKEGHLPVIQVEHNVQYYRYFHRWKWDPEKLKIDFSASLKDIHFFICANTQESYQYLGPVCRINGTKYLIRESGLLNLLPSFPNNANIINTPVGKAFIKDKFLYIFRDNEESILEIRRIQKFDEHYPIRRSNTPDYFLGTAKTINIEEI